jgi:hypothetical protein
MADIDERFYLQIDMKVPPTKDTHVVTKKYVHDFIAGKVKNNVRVVITDVLADFTYSSDTKTLTAGTTGELIAYDGVTLALNDRVLVTNRSSSTENGIYELTTVGAVGVAAIFTRAEDWDSNDDIISNVRIPVTEGTVNGDTFWVLTTDGTIVLDSTGLIFIKLAPATVVPPTNANAKIVQIPFAANSAVDSWDLVHNLGTELIQVQVYDSTKQLVTFAIKIKDSNTVTISSGYVLPGTDAFIAVIIGYTA